VKPVHFLFNWDEYNRGPLSRKFKMDKLQFSSSHKHADIKNKLIN